MKLGAARDHRLDQRDAHAATDNRTACHRAWHHDHGAFDGDDLPIGRKVLSAPQASESTARAPEVMVRTRSPASTNGSVNREEVFGWLAARRAPFRTRLMGTCKRSCATPCASAPVRRSDTPPERLDISL